MQDHKYGALELRKAANISKVLYDQWKARGFIKSKHEVQGTGRPQLYNFAEVFRVALLARLVSLGISVSVASMHVDHVHGFKDSDTYLVIRRYPDLRTDGADFADSSGTLGQIIRESKLMAELSKHEAAAVVCLDKVEERVKKALES